MLLFGTSFLDPEQKRLGVTWFALVLANGAPTEDPGSKHLGQVSAYCAKRPTNHAIAMTKGVFEIASGRSFGQKAGNASSHLHLQSKI